MATISSLGAGSGLDLNSLLEQLVAAERQPALERLNRREAGIQARISAFGSLKAAASKVEDAVRTLRDLTAGRAATVTGAVEALTAAAGDAAALGRYGIAVEQLAASQSLLSQAYASTDTVLGGGTLTIRFGSTDYDPDTDTYNGFTAAAGTPVEIEIEAGSTVAQVRDAINAANAGITATLLSDGSGQRLLLSSDRTGAEGTLEIQVQDLDGNDGDAAGLSALAFNAASRNVEQTVAGRDARFTLNGATITAARNEDIEPVEGLTIDLLALTESQEAVVKVSDRTASVRGALDAFVTAYNELGDLVGELSAFDADSGAAGELLGDATLRGLARDFRNQLSRGIPGAPDGLDSLIELGIETDKEGRLSVDGERLERAMETDFAGVVAYINSAGKGFLETVEKYTAGDGLLDVRTEGARSRLEDIAEDREDLADRIERLEARLARQFANLDTLIANLQSTSQFISSQLATLDFSPRDSRG